MRNTVVAVTAFITFQATAALAAGPECAAVFANETAQAVPPGAISSPRIEDHMISVGDARFLPLMNSASLARYVEHGGRPKDGMHPAWSSTAALSQVLGLRGPLGPWGPLGRAYGVFGKGPTHPSYWINQFFGIARQNPVMNFWLDITSSMSPTRSPFSPLKEFGPLYGDFDEGVYNVLGTPGFLGALVLGPEGPVGGLQARGLRGPDESGRYTDPRTGKFVDAIEMKVGGQKRNYRVFKYQSAEFVKSTSAKAELDTSFAVDDELAAGAASRSYEITNPDTQLISFLVIPSAEASRGLARSADALNFDLIVRDETGRVLLESKEKSLANFVQLKASKGARLSVEVKRQGERASGASAAGGTAAVDTAGVAAFRLLVVGDPFFDLAAEGALEAPQAMPMPNRTK